MKVRPSLEHSNDNPSRLLPGIRVSLLASAAAVMTTTLLPAVARADDDWIRPACDASALASPTSDTCDGPWQFDYEERCSDPAICGYSSACQTYATCSSWNWGITTSNDHETPGTQYQFSIIERCTGPDYGDCTTSTSGTAPAGRCNAVATTRRNAILATVPAGVPGYAAWLPTFAVFGNPANVTETTTTTGGSLNRPLVTKTTTSFTCDLQVVNEPGPTTATRAECGCATFVPNTCVCEQGVMFTEASPDAPYPTDADAGPNRSIASQANCTTCDFNGDPTAHPGSVLSCLTGNLGGDVPPEVEQARKARLKLLLQVAGDGLTEPQRTIAEAAYSDVLAPAPICQERRPSPADCKVRVVSPTGVDVTAWVQLCSDLAAPHVPTEVVAVELPACVATLSEIAALGAGNCRAGLLEQASDVYFELVEKTTLAFDPAGDVKAQVQASLVALDQWYDAVSPAADRAWVARRGSEIARMIVARAHAATGALPASVSSDAAAAAIVDDASDAGFATDWAILEAAFDPSSPIDSPPLLYVVADVLRGTNERLGRVAPVHDVACRFAGCDPVSSGGTARTTPFSSALRALAALDDAPALASVLGGASGLAARHPDLVAALDAIADGHGALASAWARAGGGSIAALGDPSAEVPIEGVELAAMVRAARSQVDSYLASGRVDPSAPRLSAAVLKQEQLVSFLDSGVQTIEGAKNAYVAARLAIVNNLIEQTRTTGAAESMAIRAVSLRDQATVLFDQLAGLQAREKSEEQAFAELMASFEQVIGSGALDADAAFDVDVLPPVVIGPAQVTFDEGETFSVAAHRSAVVTLAAGETLDIDMTDATWTPSCALSAATIAAPDGSMVGIDVGGAVAGPEGYHVSWSNSGYSAVSAFTSSSSTRSTSDAWEECLGGGIAITGIPIISDIFSFTGTAKDCSTLASSLARGSGTQDSTGEESRFTASFNAGLRLPSTPWTTATAGSLLAFLSPHGSPDSVLDVRAVGVRDAIHAPSLAASQDVDISFVVNDFACGTTNDALTLQMKVVTPFGAAAADVSAAMAQTVTDIAAAKASYLAQGGLTAHDSGEIRTSAWARLTQRLAARGRGLQGLPQELKTLFDASIEKEIASLGRLSEMDRVGRELRRVNLELKAMETELGSLGEQSRLLDLVPRWHLRDLSGVELAPAMSGLGASLTDYVAPIFELRDPARMTTFRANAAAQLNALLAVDFAAPMDDVAADLQLFAMSARQSVAAAQFELPSTARRTIALAFPRDPGACQGELAGDCAGFRVASMRSSETLWSGITGDEHVGELEVQPADLYALGGGNSQLSCQDLAPVVRRAAVYLLNGTSSADLQAVGRELPAIAGEGGSRFTFPRVGGVVDFTADTTDGVPLALPVLNGFGGDVLTDFGTSTELGVGAGISPFARFAIDFSSFYTDLPLDFIDGTSVAILVLEVERQVSAQSSFVPGVCQNAITP